MQFRSAAFIIASIIYFFYKTNYLNEEVNRTKPSHLASVLWSSACKAPGVGDTSEYELQSIQRAVCNLEIWQIKWKYLKVIM